MSLPIYERKPVQSNTSFQSSSSRILGSVQSASERLNARLSGLTDQAMEFHKEEITEDTIQKALEDVKNGNINSDNVSRVARDTYRKTANHALVAETELSGEQLATKIKNEQIKNNRYSSEEFNKSWDSYTKSSLDSVQDVSIRENIKNRLDKMGLEYSSAISTMEAKQNVRNQKISLTSSIDLNTKKMISAYSNNAEDSAIYKSRVVDSLNSLVDSNYITREEYEQQLRDLDKKEYVEQQRSKFQIEAIKGKGREFIDKFMEKDHKLLDFEDKRILASKLNSFANIQQSKRKGQRDSFVQQNKQVVKDATDLLNKGFLPENIEEAKRIASISGDKDAIKFSQSITNYNKTLEMKGMSSSELNKHIFDLESKKTMSKDDFNSLEMARKYQREVTSKAKKDTVSLLIDDNFASSEDMGTISLDDFSSADDRLQYEGLTKEKYGTSMKLLNKEEETRVIDALKNSPINEKLQILNNIVDLSDEASNKILDQVGGKKAGTYSFAGRMLKSGNNLAAQTTLQGVGADIKFPEGFKQEIQTRLSGTLSLFSQEKYNEYLNGVTDFVKGKALNGEEIDLGEIEEYFEQSIGAVKEINDKQLILPFGVSSGDFEDWLDNIVIEDNPELTEVLQDMTDFVGGNNYQLHYRRDGEYLLYNPDYMGVGGYVFDEDNQPLTIKWGQGVKEEIKPTQEPQLNFGAL